MFLTLQFCFLKVSKMLDSPISLLIRIIKQEGWETKLVMEIKKKKKKIEKEILR